MESRHLRVVFSVAVLYTAVSLLLDHLWSVQVRLSFDHEWDQSCTQFKNHHSVYHLFQYDNFLHFMWRSPHWDSRMVISWVCLLTVFLQKISQDWEGLRTSKLAQRWRLVWVWWVHLHFWAWVFNCGEICEKPPKIGQKMPVFPKTPAWTSGKSHQSARHWALWWASYRHVPSRMIRCRMHAMMRKSICLTVCDTKLLSVSPCSVLVFCKSR